MWRVLKIYKCKRKRNTQYGQGPKDGFQYIYGKNKFMFWLTKTIL